MTDHIDLMIKALIAADPKSQLTWFLKIYQEMQYMQLHTCDEGDVESVVDELHKIVDEIGAELDGAQQYLREGSFE